MDFSKGLIHSISEFEKLSQPGELGDYRHAFLDWAAGSGPLQLSVFENKSKIYGETFYRYSVEGLTQEGNKSTGFGCNKDQCTAAVIAVMEALERFVTQQFFLKNSIEPTMRVNVSEGQFKFVETQGSDIDLALPTKGFQTSNGWALHFDAATAAHNATREALERHLLLSTYIAHGWDGFRFKSPIRYEDKIFRSAESCITAGGFSAGLVQTTGTTALGSTFGYLCDQTDKLIGSARWQGAFYESFAQWVDLTSATKPQELTPIQSDQWHYLETPLPNLNDGVITTYQQLESITGNIIIIDLQKVLLTAFPLFAAFVYGGDFLPLAVKSKLNSDELQHYESQLQRLGINKPLPEVHPIL